MKTIISITFLLLFCLNLSQSFKFSTSSNDPVVSEIRWFDNYPFTNTIDNIGYIGYGYNIIFGNPRSTAGGVDPGIRKNQIFDLQYSKNLISGDTRWNVTDHCHMRMTVGCYINEKSEEYRSVTSYKRELSREVSVGVSADDVGLGAFGFAASGEYKEIEQKTTSQHTVFVEKDAQCSVYQISIDVEDPPRLHPSFINTLKKLADVDPETNPYPFFYFFEDYGTHYPISVEMGAKYGMISELTSTEYENLVSNSKGSTLSLSLGVVSGGSEGSLMAENANNEKTELSNTLQYSTGSIMPADKNMNTWAQNAAKEPMPIKYVLGSIDKVLDDPFTLDDLTPDQKTSLRDKIKTVAKKYVSYLYKRGDIVHTDPPVVPPNPNACVQLFTKPDYEGDSITACKNIADINTLNDKVNSIRIPTNYGKVVSIFEDKNYGGGRLNIDNKNFSNLATEGWSDKLSSVIVNPNECAKFKDRNTFSSDQSVIICGDVHNTEDSYDFDTINEVEMLAGEGKTRVLTYEDARFRGKETKIEKNGKDFDIDVMSMQISEIKPAAAGKKRMRKLPKEMLKLLNAGKKKKL